MRDIGKNIKSIRQSKGMTQDALADRLFVTRQTISNYENGRSRPDLDMLLRIADILETDVNAIIYGPPIPQRKKDDYKWLAISTSILLFVVAVYATIQIAFSDILLYGYAYSARLINQLAILPFMMFILGWTLVHSLSIIGNLRQLGPNKIKIARFTVLVLLILFMAIPAPLIIWLGFTFYRSVTTHSVSMRFPYIPVYQEILAAIVWLTGHAPFSYTVLGGAFWLLGFPRVRKEDKYL